jgi:hypothetical protein
MLYRTIACYKASRKTQINVQTTQKYSNETLTNKKSSTVGKGVQKESVAKAPNPDTT